MLKTCSRCRLEKEIAEYHKDNSAKDGFRSACKTCVSQYNKTIPSLLTRARSLKSRYGISIEQYEEMLNSQNGKCAICASSSNGYRGKYGMAVDHCHLTGKVRSLLCNRCNNGIGHFQDNLNLMYKAVKYLECHRRA